MYAAVNGYMDDVDVNRITEFEERLLSYLETSKSDLLKSIGDTKELDDAAESSLKEAITSFKATFS